jgi:OOP family OmpA-OmpF porin
MALFAALGMAGFATSASAQVPITITLGGTHYTWDSDRSIDDEVVPAGAIEYRFGENWAAEFNYAAGEVNDSNTGQDVDIDTWHLGGLYYITPQDSLHPYLGFGAGELNRDFDSGSEGDTQLNVGAGFRYYFTDHWNWRADARYLYAPDDERGDIALSLGISYSFAPPPSRKRAEPAPAPVAAAAVAAAPVEKDSDGDGVLDKNDQCPGTPPNTRVDERGCEIERVEVASIELKINFAFDSDVVQDRYMAELKGLADFLEQADHLNVEIEGHTDSQGPDEYNEGLSQRRANAVKKVLVDKFGIADSRLHARGYGESQPVDTNDTKAGRAENRRVMATLKD